jgi:predicted Zn-dependent protease
MLLAVWPARTADAREIALIRDAEIEDIIHAYTTPLFQQAGLNPGAIDVYLVKDDSLNAFVAGGQNLFLHTGFLQRTVNAEQVLGVLAHETGHIAGGHVAARAGELKDAARQSLVTYVLGLGAAIATGRPELAAATIIGGQDIALKNLLKYSRGQESAADQAAVRLLERTGHSPEGLLEFFDIIRGQEVLLSNNQDPYVRTHPLTEDRLRFVEQAVRDSPYSGQPAHQDLEAMHARMKAKLVGFLEPHNRVLRQYPESDTSVPARYARAISHYLRADLDRALELIDGLIAEYPDDPYFHELKGQMLFENGRIAESRAPYEKAVALRPNSPLLRLGLARAQLEANDPALNGQALAHLKEVVRNEPENATAWRFLAVAHGRAGDTGLTALSLSEAAFARGDYKQAQEQSRRAQQLLAENSPAWLRAADIEGQAERAERKRN